MELDGFELPPSASNRAVGALSVLVALVEPVESSSLEGSNGVPQQVMCACTSVPLTVACLA